MGYTQSCSYNYSAEIAEVERQLGEGRTLRQIIPLRLRKILKKCLWSVLGIIVVWCAASYFVLAHIGKYESDGSGKMLWVAWVLLLFVLLAMRMAYQFIYLLMYGYDVDEQGVRIKKGVVAKVEVTLPFSKITDVYVDQDVPDVLLGLYDVHISSPTVQSGQYAHIDGVDRHGAAIIKQLILQRIRQQDNS